MAIPLPLIGAGLQAGGSILGSILGARAANQNAAYNAAIQNANLQRADAADMRAQMAAQQQLRRDQLGSVDAQGNRVFFDPVRGWVTELSPEQQALQTASQAGQLFNLTEGERLRQEGVQRSAGAQRDEAGQANALMEQIARFERTDPGALANQIFAAGEIGRTQAEDRIGEDLATQMVRQGNISNFGDIAASRAREGARASEEARRRAALEAPDIARQRDDASLANASNLYNLFRSRASSPSGVQFSPVLARGPQAPSTGIAEAALINAAARRPAQLDYVQPNFGVAGAIPRIGDAFSGLFEQIGARNAEEESRRRLQDQNTQRTVGTRG